MPLRGYDLARALLHEPLAGSSPRPIVGGGVLAAQVSTVTVVHPGSATAIEPADEIFADLLAAVSTGRRWCGREVERSTVLLLSNEPDRRRGGDALVAVAGQFGLDDRQGIVRLTEVVQRLGDRGSVVLGVDTLRAVEGLSDARREPEPICRALAAVAELTGAAVLVRHPGTVVPLALRRIAEPVLTVDVRHDGAMWATASRAIDRRCPPIRVRF